jgi:hypothetical protein
MSIQFKAIATSNTPTLRAECGEYSCEIFAPEGTEDLSTSGSDHWKLWIVERTTGRQVAFVDHGSGWQFEDGDHELGTKIPDVLLKDIEAAVSVITKTYSNAK